MKNNGEEVWFYRGLLHRDDDLPAIIHQNFDREWWFFGRCHRENDKPARIFEYGRQEWWYNGVLHRLGNKPAVVDRDKKSWYILGKLHREDGPAVEHEDGTFEWYFHGLKISESDLEKINKLKSKRVSRAIKTMKKYLLPKILDPKHKIGERLLEENWI